MVIGPRQAGKSTFAQSLGSDRTYVTLDDPLDLARAKANPGEFLDSFPGAVTIDEIQRAPELMLPLKLRIDRDRRSGRFLLTGSANVLVLPKVADSLAGRLEVIELLPLTQAELEGQASRFLTLAFGEGWPGRQQVPPDAIEPRLVRGGFPEPASRGSAARRRQWFASYLRTLIERDIRDLGNIDGLTQVPRLLTLLAGEVGASLNVDSLSRESGIAATTLRRYLDLLKALFLIQLVPAWSTTTSARLAKTAKAYLLDSAFVGYLLGLSDEGLAVDAGRRKPVLENFVANELARLAGQSETPVGLYHLRTVRQKEVPFVLEGAAGTLVGINVTTQSNLMESDWEGLEYLEALSPDRFLRGIVLYAGSEIRALTTTIVALPYSVLWSGTTF
jgi:predicted AAA+ superfamily ATPase